MFNYLFYGCFKKTVQVKVFNKAESEMFNYLLYGCFKKTVQVKYLITYCTDALRRQYKWNV